MHKYDLLLLLFCSFVNFMLFKLTGISCNSDDIVSYENQQISKKSSYYFGEFVTLKCVDGYKLNGIDSQFCKQDGSWSFANPSCVGRFKLIPSILRGLCLVAASQNKLWKYVLFICVVKSKPSGSIHLIITYVVKELAIFCLIFFVCACDENVMHLFVDYS